MKINIDELLELVPENLRTGDRKRDSRFGEYLLRTKDLTEWRQFRLVLECCEEGCGRSIEYVCQCGKIRWADDLFENNGWMIGPDGKVKCPPHAKLSL